MYIVYLYLYLYIYMYVYKVHIESTRFFAPFLPHTTIHIIYGTRAPYSYTYILAHT